VKARLVVSSFVWLALASILGCGGGGTHAPFAIELAPMGDCSTDNAELPVDVRFFTLQVCASHPPAGMSGCVGLTDTGGDHGGGATTLRIARTLDRRFTVDARVDGGTDYDVTVVAYGGPETGTCSPRAIGHARGVRFGNGTVRVRLHPLGAWSCAGTHEGQTTPVPRALHQAVLLPDGEVLVLGGIAGPTAGATNFAHPSLAQRLVEVFDPRDARFHAVTINDEGGMPGFSRVLFQARYVSTSMDGHFVVHVFGGFDIDGAPEGGVGFDANGNLTTISALFGPLTSMPNGMGAGFRGDAVIDYDPVARTATVTAASGMGTYTTTAATDAAPFAIVRSIDSVPTMTSGRPTYGLSASWYLDGAAPHVLMQGRLGASITPIGAAGSAFLVWGGNVATAMTMPVTPPANLTGAGEVVTGSMSTPVPAEDPAAAMDTGHPYATAFHTATPIGGVMGTSSILFVGGYTVNGGSAPLAPIAAAPSAMTVARFAADGSFASGVRVMGRPVSTGLHTATAVDANTVLIVGGASVSSAGGIASTLNAETSTGTVAYNSTTMTYAWRALPNLTSGRWGHTTTVIPNQGVLVLGGMSRTDTTLTVSDGSDFLVWEDLTGAMPPGTMSCAMADDAGTPTGDAGGTDAGPRPDGGALDAGATDAGPRDAATSGG
jgi:hypothetical protein